MALAEQPPAVDEKSRGDAKNKIEGISRLLFQLEGLLAGASYFLPPFEIRNLGSVISASRAKLDTIRAKLLPRQRFRFSKPDIIVNVDDPLLQVRTLLRSYVLCFLN